MNKDLFDKASAQYEEGDYRGALMDFTACLQDGEFPLEPGDMGLLYHRIGNCLTKMKNPTEAIQSYTLALSDEDYDARGMLECNLGLTYAALHDYEDAVAHFRAAITEESYDFPHKAYMGMGNALLKLGKSAEAGVAFREAALDDANPDPAGSLLNLGICFMALDRPEDAVVTYESAMQFDMRPDTRNKLYASLGQAHVACGDMEPAVKAFEMAIADKSYLLSDSASVDYQRAVDAVARGTVDRTQVIDAVDMSGLDISADGSSFDDYTSGDEAQDPFYYDEGYDEENYPGYVVGAYKEDDNRFFDATEGEIEQWAADLARQDRKRRSVGLKALVVVIIVVIVLFLLALFAYTQGYGYPSQEDVVNELFSNPEEAASSVFSPAASDASINTMVGEVVQDPNVVIEGINSSAAESTVYATAKTPQGGEVTYRLTLVRDFIGWKISNIDLYLASQN